MSWDDVVAVVWVPDDAGRFVDTLRSLLRAHPDLRTVAAGVPGRSLAALTALGAETTTAADLAGAVNTLAAQRGCHVLCVADGVVFPEHALSAAVEAVERDIRVASVSFWSNAAGPASFPHWWTQAPQPPPGHNEATLTRKLRQGLPDARPVPIHMPAGGAILFSAAGLSAVGGLANSTSLDVIAVDYGFRAQARGLVNLLDPTTYLFRPTDLSDRDPLYWLTPGEDGWIRSRHPAWVGTLTTERGVQRPLSNAHGRARAALDGLRVTIDATSLGPIEMGTQVQTVSLIRALLDQPEINELCVALPGPVPEYARHTLEHPKVRAAQVGFDLSEFGPVDIVHRPFQPTRKLDLAAWAAGGARTVVTIQDLVSYRNANYHEGPEAWLEYREVMAHTAAGVDALVVISDDVIASIHDEEIPIEAERVFRVPNGTDHLDPRAPERTPAAFLDPAVAADPYILVLGANYAHKNRDLAVRAYLELRRRGHHFRLVLVGAQVPYGSSRRDEAWARGLQDGVLELPDVAGDERVWLLRHASLLLYPSSAEGFGLVPYEAAHLGTATVWAGFGPLVEVMGREPTASPDWAPEHLADAAEALLLEPLRADEQIRRTLDSGKPYSWHSTARQLIDVYKAVLGRPSRSEAWT